MKVKQKETSRTQIFVAKKILTMNPAQPVATHVAVRDGRILAVGNEEEVRSWSSGDEAFEIDQRYADDVLLPGFVEGHSHLFEGVVWRYVYLGFFDRHGPDGKLWPGLKSTDQVIERLKEFNDQLAEGEVLIGWGFDPIYFGDSRMTVHDLDQISTTRPIVIMHASMHLMNVNTVMLQEAGIDRFTDIDGVAKFDDGEPTGELLEFAAMFPVTKYIGNPIRTLDHSAESLKNFAKICRGGGVTTATDLASMINPDGIETLSQEADDPLFPVRIVSAASGRVFGNDVQGCLDALAELRHLAHDKLHLGIIKLVVDGSIQGFTARVQWPGYYNGAPNGIWVIAPEEINKLVMEYHRAGVQMHIHTNGDEATELAINAIEQALTKHPRPDHRHTLQHCQMANRAQYQRMSKLGICVNLFSNHLFYWGDEHYEMTIGPERAERMNACRTALEHDVPLAIHSDAPVTPMGPLFTAWCAVNRVTASGRQLGEYEQLTIPEALFAITMGAAYTLHLDHLIGSIEVGKYADFCVLAQDPMGVLATEIKNIQVVDTVIGGVSTKDYR